MGGAVRRKKRARRVGCAAAIAFLIILAYELAGFLLPPLWQKDIPSVDMAALCTDQQESVERVCSVDDNQDALLWRLRLIDMAEETITVAIFDWRGDVGGHAIMAALAGAADRGVAIRILIDGMNATAYALWDTWFQALSTRPGVAIRLYNPPNLLRPWTINYRMHDKYIIIDDTAYILGGRNLHDNFLGNVTADTEMDAEVDTEVEVDRDVVVYTEQAAEDASIYALGAYFEEIWALDDNRPFTANENPSATAELLSCAGDLRAQYPEAYTAVEWATETVPTNGIRLLSNPVTVGNKSPVLWAELACLMEQGEDVWIQTPYVVCNEDMYERLDAVGASNFRIMTNAVANGLNPFGCSDYLNEKDRILATGAEVLEWMDGHSLHTKTILLDDCRSVVGSYNLDMRSTYLDTELMLLIDSPAFNAQLRSTFEEMSQACRIVSPDGTTAVGPLCAELDFPIGKRLFYSVLRVIQQPFRYLI